MIDIKKGTRIIERIPIKTHTITINSANIIEVEVGTNGLRGGDIGHGSRTYFRFKDCAATYMQIKVLSEGEFELELCGDTELETFTEALEFSLKMLNASKEQGTAPA